MSSLKLYALLPGGPQQHADAGIPQVPCLSVVPAESRVIWPLALKSLQTRKSWAKKNPSVLLDTSKVPVESSHVLLRHPESRSNLLSWHLLVFCCLWAAGLWLSKTLYCIEQLQPQQPSQPCFSSQDQEPLPGELWPRELGLMNCFSIQIWHHSSLLSPWLSPSLVPVLTFIILTLPIPCLKVIWEWGTEEGRSWLSSAPFGTASPSFPQIWQQQMSKARVLVNIRCCRFVFVLVSFLWLQLLHF